jgi:hypothetical protein
MSSSTGLLAVGVSQPPSVICRQGQQSPHPWSQIHPLKLQPSHQFPWEEASSSWPPPSASQAFFFPMDRLVTPIKRLLSVLHSWAPHQIPRELMATSFQQQRGQQLAGHSSVRWSPSFRFLMTMSTATHCHSLTGQLTPTAGPSWTKIQMSSQFLWEEYSSTGHSFAILSDPSSW